MGKRRGSGLREMDVERQRQKNDRKLGSVGRAERDRVYQQHAAEEEKNRRKP